MTLTVEVVPDLVGVAEAAEIMGWDKRRVITYIDRGSFPEPITSLASGRIWLREDVEALRRRLARAAPREATDARQRARRGPREADRVTQRLYLIRHGQADYTLDARLRTPRGVAFDPPLSATGREQARGAGRTAPAPARRPPPSTRPRSPAPARRPTPTRTRRASRSIEREDLCEWYGGGWEFKDFSQIFDEHPDARHLFRTQQPAWHLAPEAETGADFAARVAGRDRGGARRARARATSICSCHGGVINAFLAPILGIHGQEMFFLPANTSINTVLVDGDERRAWFLSDDAHLTNPEWFEPADRASIAGPRRRLYFPRIRPTRKGGRDGRQVPLTRMGRRP